MGNDLKGIIKKYSRKLEPVSTGIIEIIHPVSNIKAALFDIYGTLFISEAGDISLASEKQNKSFFIETLKLSGIDHTDGENLYSLYIAEIQDEHARLKREGINYPEVVITDIWKSILEKGAGVTADRDLLEKAAVTYESLSNITSPMPGAAEIIRFLTGRHIVTGVISNAQFYTPLLFDSWFGQSMEEMGFDKDISVYSYMIHKGKPDLSLFIRSLETLDKKYSIKPEEVLYIGNDMLNDIKTAHSAGMTTALFAGDRRSLRLREENSECRILKPDLIITDLLQIKQIII